MNRFGKTLDSLECVSHHDGHVIKFLRDNVI